MSLIVQKFGGSSVSDTHHVFNVAKKIVSCYKEGNDIIVVVSAQGDTTDDLIKMSNEVNPNASKREMDALLSAGEQISASLLAMAIQSLGIPAISLTGWQAGFKTDSSYSNAKILEIVTERMKKEIKKKNVIVVAGFQGIDILNNITTFGRGGSDTSAVAIAGAMNADICKIYTDVDGIYTADPRIVTSAKKLESISYEEMFKLSELGAQVMNDRSIKTAQDYGVEIEVLSSMKADCQGTVIKSTSKRNSVSGIAVEKDMIKFIIHGIKNTTDSKKEIMSELISRTLIKDINLLPTGKKMPETISFLIESSKLTEVLNFLKTALEKHSQSEIFYEVDKSKISVVNISDSVNVNIASVIFETLHESNINIEMASCDNSRVSVVIDSEDLHRAVNDIHNKLFEEDYLI